MTFKDIVDRLEIGNLHGEEIASYRSYCAANLFRMYEEYGECLSFGAEWTTANREKHKSQAECERADLATDPGKKETKLKYLIKGVEAISETLTSLWFQVNKEAREANRS